MHVEKLVIYPEHVEAKGRESKRGGIQGKRWSKAKPTHHFSEHRLSNKDSPEEESPPSMYSIFTFGQKNTTQYKVNLSINGTPVYMEVDTGVSLSIIIISMSVVNEMKIVNKC